MNALEEASQPGRWILGRAVDSILLVHRIGIHIEFVHWIRPTRPCPIQRRSLRELVLDLVRYVLLGLQEGQVIVQTAFLGSCLRG